jgi:hypothetical protein
MDTIKPQATMQLIGYGRVAAIQASELKVGDVIVWNYGYTSTVAAISPRGITQIKVSMEEGMPRQVRTFNKTRLVAVKGQ